MLCLVPPSVNGLDEPATAARFETKMREEHLAVHQMFTARPELLRPVNELLQKFRSENFPCESGGEVHYWRRVVSHFQRHPNEDFDDLDPFYVVDFGAIIRQMAKFRKHLPMVIPHYAVKCNPSESIVAMIAALGGGFDCASSGEFQMVLNSRFAEVDDIIFANPCKSRQDLKKAEAMGVRLVTFDNAQELHKIATYMPSAKAVLRLKTDDAAAVCAFSRKFGAGMSDVPELLSIAKELGVRVVGVSFHVGSGNNDPNAYVGSIMNARSVFDQGEALGFDMKILDIGGGFPGTEPPTGPDGKPECLSFEEIAACIRPVLEEHFQTARIIAEPGRYYAAASHTLAVNVHSKRVVKHANGVHEHQIYINDGLYHSFNSIMFDHAHPGLHLLAPDAEARMQPTTIFGPTCDSLDCILKMQMFPEVDIGEWMFAHSMGAYTTAAGAPFNGFATRRMEYICSLPSSCFSDLIDC